MTELDRGLITSKFAPCIMERDDKGVEWRHCPLLGDALVER